MHTWIALGILGGALLSAGAAWKLRSSAALLNDAARAEDTRWRTIVQGAYPQIMKAANIDPETELNKILTRDEQERERNKIEPTRPIVQELETLSMALADPEVDLESIAFSGGANASVIITILVPDIKQGESVFKSLSSISGSNIESWQQPTFSPSGAKIRGAFTGKWRNPKASPASASQPSRAPAPKPAPAGTGKPATSPATPIAAPAAQSNPPKPAPAQTTPAQAPPVSPTPAQDSPAGDALPPRPAPGQPEQSPASAPPTPSGGAS